MHKEFALFIDGTWCQGRDGRFEILINPANEQAIGQVAWANRDDLDNALSAAQRSFSAWFDQSPTARAEILKQAATLLNDQIESAAAALTLEQGKTLSESRHEWKRSIETFVWHAQVAVEIFQPREFPSTDADRYVAPAPLGVVAAFTPWNYPAIVTARKLASALAAGCTVILKASEEAPSSATIMMEALAKAGIPPGVVNLVFGDPPAISQHLLASPIVKALSFTGSTAVGKQLAKLAADSLKRCVLELGGHAPVLVFADADIAAAVKAIAAYKFECSGQSCNAPSRIYVHESVYDLFLTQFIDVVKDIQVGDGMDKETDMGPLANSRRLEAMKSLMANALGCGANILTGGNQIPRPGYFWQPTVLTDVPDTAVMMTEEPFGPVIPIASFTTFDEVIERANRNPYGFAAYVFTQSPSTAEAAAQKLEVGSVCINQLKGVAPDTPVGGVKDSGYGYEGGTAGIETFLNLKLINRQVRYE